jgi:Ca2+/Na+ antiporter
MNTYSFTFKEDSKFAIKDAILLVGILFAFLGFYYIRLSLVLVFVYVGICFLVMALLSEKLLDAGMKFCLKMKISPFLLGLLILPFLSSLHEQLTMIFTNTKEVGMGEFSLALQLGNKLFELLISFGVIGAILIIKKHKPMMVTSDQRRITIVNGVMMIFASLLLGALVLFDNSLETDDGFVLILFYGVFLAVVYYINKNIVVEEDEDEDVGGVNALLEIVKMMIYLAIIIGIADFVSTSIIQIADSSDHFKRYAFFYVGILMALPNMVISIIGLVKNKLNVVIALNIGSAIWELSISVALISFVAPITGLSSELVQYFIIVMIVTTIVAVVYIRTHWELRLWETLGLVVLYILIVVFVFVLF